MGTHIGPLGPSSPSHGPPKSFEFAVCRWFNGIWCVHKLLQHFSTLYRSKMEKFPFDIVTTHNHEICYVKHVLAPLYVVFTLFGCWGGVPRGPGHNLLMQFSSLGNSKMEISKPVFCYILTIQNDQISYVKHVLAPLYVFFTLFGCGGGGGAPKGSRAQPAYAVCQPRQLKNGNFQFNILTIQNDQISYVKHVLAPLYVFFTLFGCFGVRGGSQGGRGTTCLCNFLASAAQKWKFPNLFFVIFLPSKMIKYPM